MTKFLVSTLFALTSISFLGYSQNNYDSTLITMKNGTVYKLNLIEKKDNKIYRKISRNSNEIKSSAKITENGLIYQKADKMPEFQGGLDNFRKYITDNLRYPIEAQKKGIQENVFVEFIVNELGEVKHTKTYKGKNELLIKEAIRVVESSPKWEPGYIDDKPVKVLFVIPVYFILR